MNSSTWPALSQLVSTAIGSRTPWDSNSRIIRSVGAIPAVAPYTTLPAG